MARYKASIRQLALATGIVAILGVSTSPALACDRAKQQRVSYSYDRDHDRGYDDEITVRASRLPTAPNNDSNKFWLDYRTDVSEAERELASDLRRATDEEDRREAWAEYYNELRDAKKDYAEEMTERGYIVRNFRPNRRELALYRR